MKMKIIVVLGLFLVAAYTSRGQSWKDKSPEEKSRYYTRQMAEDLALDDSVILKIFQINVAVSKKFDSLYADKNNPNARKGAALIYQFRNEAYREVLTTKQYLKFEDLERERREKRVKEKADDKK